MRVKTPERVTRSLWLRDKVCGRKGKSKTLQWHIKDIFPSVNKVVTTWVLQIIPDTLQGKISVGDAQWRCLPSAYLCLLVRRSLWARLWQPDSCGELEVCWSEVLCPGTDCRHMSANCHLHQTKFTIDLVNSIRFPISTGFKSKIVQDRAFFCFCFFFLWHRLGSSLYTCMWRVKFDSCDRKQ